MAKVLTDIVVNEVSFVERGADADAHVVLFKSAASKETDVTTKTKPNPRLEKALDGQSLELPDAVIAALNEALGEETASEETPPEDVTTPEDTTTTTTTGEAPDKVVTVEDAEAPEPTPAPEPAFAKSDEVVALEKRLAEAEKVSRDAQERLNKAERAEAIRTEVEKVRTELPALSVDADELATVMFRIGKGESDADDAKKVYEVLAAASRAVSEAGLFSERGSAIGDDDSDPFGKVVARMKVEDPNLTHSKAVDKALTTKEGREAYARARSSK